MKTLILVLALAFATISDAIAERKLVLNGKELLHNCKLLLDAYDNNKDLVGEDEAAAKLCKNLVVGIGNTMWIYHSSGGVHPELRFCLPFDQRPYVGERLVVQFLEKNPIHLSQSGWQLVMGCLAESIPLRTHG